MAMTSKLARSGEGAQLKHILVLINKAIDEGRPGVIAQLLDDAKNLALKILENEKVEFIERHKR